MLLSFAISTILTVGYPISPVPFTDVNVTEGFWGNRLEASREVTIPLAFSKCESTGRYDNFVKAARALANPADTSVTGGYPFDDTDVYKTIEGASYVLSLHPDPVLDAYLDSVITLIAAAQEPDGYLYTERTMNPVHPHSWTGPNRWDKVEAGSHEFYNLGHMVEAAIAHYQATGKRNFLDIAMRFADCVCREIGDGPGQLNLVPGHQIAEMALAKLYAVTGDKKYLAQAKSFLDRRGRTEHREAYNQTHLPVLEQDEAVGHAVRAEYMYSGMAEVAALSGDESYINAIDRIWENIAAKKLYITGGVGARHAGEAFGDDYELPNATAYCETCAAIGNVYFNYRMFLLHGDSKYFDVLERSLYNAVLSGISLEGDGFFYPNPLESPGGYAREPWFGCACCPSNICRFIPSVPGYIYAVNKKDLYVNLFIPGTMSHKLKRRTVTLTQETAYPWNGDIKITVDRNKARRFALRIRIPGWVRGEVVPSDLYTYADGKTPGFSVNVNGKEVKSEIEDGYFTIKRRWKKGDVVRIHFDMEPRLVKANSSVEADRGRIAVEKGPLVYCAEGVDNPGISVLEASLGSSTALRSEHRDDLLRGIDVVKAGSLTLIPYYAWCHRGAGEMEVWFREQ